MNKREREKEGEKRSLNSAERQNDKLREITELRRSEQDQEVAEGN